MRENVDRTFDVIGLMEELRDVWRKSAPLYNLLDEEREKVVSIIRRAKELLEEMERSFDRA